MAGKVRHRGRVQAQGGGTEKARAELFSDLRRFIHSAAKAGGLSAPVSKSFLKRGAKDIRVDLEVIKGKACVPTGEEGG